MVKPRTNRRKIIILAIVVFALLVVVALTNTKLISRSSDYTYKTATIDRGDIAAYISASGTLSPVNTVDVVAQVSGVVNEIHVDFNSIVKKGEVLAQLDPTLYENQVKQAQATLNKTQAEAEKKKRIYNLYQTLINTPDRISNYELENSRVEYTSAMEQLKIAKTELERAESNLDYTTVRSPIDGVIISMNITVGAFVNPSQGYPLFVIANDLTKMNVVAHVSEADIGKLREEQEAFFEVDAYPNLRFEGVIQQIRNVPITNNNVVTYDVIILVNNNDELKLKPGMTAEVVILVASQEDVLRIPTAALRFIPPPSSLIDEESHDLKNSPMVWTLLKNGRLKAVSVETGISDDIFTQILGGELERGQEIIVGVTQKANSSSEELGPIVLPKPKRF
ncbi:MAG: efflux RND transporter periplasmic adaptor subunit [Deltaproteobacteria bacterium]|nr:efflux RND transporter periplasmic adaptor subunit [Deltaproteobacteria bacterium]